MRNRGTSSRFKVSAGQRVTKKWVIEVRAADGTRIREGFVDEVEAAKKYNEVVQKHKTNPRLNIIPE